MLYTVAFRLSAKCCHHKLTVYSAERGRTTVSPIPSLRFSSSSYPSRSQSSSHQVALYSKLMQGQPSKPNPRMAREQSSGAGSATRPASAAGLGAQQAPRPTRPQQSGSGRGGPPPTISGGSRDTRLQMDPVEKARRQMGYRNNWCGGRTSKGGGGQLGHDQVSRLHSRTS